MNSYRSKGLLVLLKLRPRKAIPHSQYSSLKDCVWEIMNRPNILGDYRGDPPIAIGASLAFVRFFRIFSYTSYIP